LGANGLTYASPINSKAQSCYIYILQAGRTAFEDSMENYYFLGELGKKQNNKKRAQKAVMMATRSISSHDFQDLDIGVVPL
jgi:hypothetical protein